MKLYPGRSCLPLAVALLAPLSSLAAGANAPRFPAPDIPAERTDHPSQAAHLALVEKTRAGRVDIYFEGDSITRRWGTSDEKYKDLLANWRTNFLGWNAADFAWGGDKTQNILWRLQHGEMDNVHPRVVVLLAGTNNVSDIPLTGELQPAIDAITRGITAVVQSLREKAPQAVIVLTAIFPRNDSGWQRKMTAINAINDQLAGLADGRKVRYININRELADATGQLHPGMVDPDQLHPRVPVYQIWADHLKPIFTEILGPPAEVDAAPPPSASPPS